MNYTMKEFESPNYFETDEPPMMAAVSNIDGGYIGPEDYAKSLETMGIAPQRSKPEHDVCSIGFCEKEQLWFGWSHRAMCGFGVGSKVSRGDCAYSPVDWDDFLACSIEFWNDESHIDVSAVKSKDDEGRDIAKVSWVYSSDPELIPNTKLHAQTGGTDMYPPDKWGHGEWTAATLEDAKQMAMDFAEGVS